MNSSEPIKKGQIEDYISDAAALELAALNERVSESGLYTLSEIRLLSGNLVSDYFYTTDLGQEGNWYYDSTDTTSADNTGTVLVTSDGKRIKRTLQNLISPLWFGAKGDGVTNDTLTLKAALSLELPVDGMGLTYKIDSEIIIYNKDILINNLKVLVGSFSNSSALVFGSNTVVQQGTITADGAGGTVTNQASNKLTFSSVVGVQVGDLVTLTSTALWYHDNRGSATKGETKLVRSISGNVVFFDTYMRDFYDFNAETLSFQVFRKLDIDINKLSIIREVTGDGSGVAIVKTIEPKINNIYIKGFGRGGLSFAKTYGGLVSNSNIEDCFVTGNGLSYGVVTDSVQGLKVVDSIFNNNRRAVDFSGGYPSRDCVVDNCYISGVLTDDSSCVGTHGASDDCTFSNNTLTHSISGVIVRGRRTIIKGNKFGRLTTNCIAHSFGIGVSVFGNEQMSYTPDSSFGNTGIFYKFTGPVSDYPTKDHPIKIKSNIIRTNSIVLDYPAIPMEYVDIVGNDIVINSLSTSGVCLMIRSATSINYSKIEDNSWTVQKGINRYIDRATTSIGALVSLEDIPLIATDVIMTGGTSISINGFLKQLKNVIEFDFLVQFTTVAVTTVKVQLPLAAGSDQLVAQGICYIGNSYNKTQSFYTLDGTGLLSISPDNVSYANTFAAGTTFSVFISGIHKSRYKY
jgi:hypothetical protein